MISMCLCCGASLKSAHHFYCSNSFTLQWVILFHLMMPFLTQRSFTVFLSCWSIGSFQSHFKPDCHLLKNWQKAFTRMSLFSLSVWQNYTLFLDSKKTNNFCYLISLNHPYQNTRQRLLPLQFVLISLRCVQGFFIFYFFLLTLFWQLTCVLLSCQPPYNYDSSSDAA